MFDFLNNECLNFLAPRSTTGRSSLPGRKPQPSPNRLRPLAFQSKLADTLFSGVPNSRELCLLESLSSLALAVNGGLAACDWLPGGSLRPRVVKPRQG